MKGKRIMTRTEIEAIINSKNSRGRRKRTHIHKGIIRIGNKCPRKLKKIREKESKNRSKKFMESEEKRLRPIYGFRWMDHIIIGG